MSHSPKNLQSYKPPYLLLGDPSYGFITWNTTAFQIVYGSIGKDQTQGQDRSEE